MLKLLTEENKNQLKNVIILFKKMSEWERTVAINNLPFDFFFFSSLPSALPCFIILLIEFQLQLNKLLEQNVIIRNFVSDKFSLALFFNFSEEVNVDGECFRIFFTSLKASSAEFHISQL